MGGAASCGGRWGDGQVGGAASSGGLLAKFLTHGSVKVLLLLQVIFRNI